MNKYLEFIRKVGAGEIVDPLVEYLNPDIKIKRRYLKAKEIKTKNTKTWIELSERKHD